MREAGSVVARTLAEMTDIALPGNTTGHLNDLAEKIILESAYIKSSFHGYLGFPAFVCTSLNDEVVHGIPSYESVLKEGDMLSIDFAASYKGWHADACVTIPVGKVSERNGCIMRAVRGALYSSIPSAKVGRHIGDISFVIQSYLNNLGCVPVTQFSGHGIGKKMHEPPQVYNFGHPESGAVMEEGMTIAIEPIGAEKSYVLVKDDDDWTYRTKGGVLTSHFEHTVLITANGPEILTKI